MKYFIRASNIGLILLLLESVGAFAQSGKSLTPLGEQLVSKMPQPKATAQEMATPCTHGPRQHESKEVSALLESRRIYIFALNAWGVKWLPSHADFGSGGCTDYAFLLMQFQRAHGAKETGYWTKDDVQKLISEVEPMAQFLSGAGQVPKYMMERIPD